MIGGLHARQTKMENVICYLLDFSVNKRRCGNHE